MKYGVTKDGFKRKNYRDIIGDMEDLAQELFGEDIDLSDRNPLGMTLQNVGWEMSNLWELLEMVYYSSFVNTSEGVSLDNVGKFIGDRRKPDQHSDGIVTIKGDEGTIIPIDFRVSTENTGVVFRTLDESVIPESGAIDVMIRSLDAGRDTNVPAGAITRIVNPITGISSVYNKEPTINGADAETDMEFRERYARSTSLGGSSTREAVEAGLLNLISVTDAFVEENDEMEYVDEIPPKSLAPFVFGGDDRVIAETILESKAGGIRSYGSTEVKVRDSRDRVHTIGFTRPEVKDIYVNMTITRGLGFPSDEVIRRAVINYIGGVDEDAIEYKGLKLGEDVVLSKLMARVMCLEGIKDISVSIGVDESNLVEDNLTIERKEIARTSPDKVVIEYV